MTEPTNLPENKSNRESLTGKPGTSPPGTGAGSTADNAAAGGGGIDPTTQNTYWRENYSSRSYVDKGATFDDYGPAYDYGLNSASDQKDRKFDDVENDLSREWDSARGKSSLTWDRARHAVRDAWDRVRNEP